MTMFGHPKRSVPKPELIGPHQSHHPMVNEPTHDWSSWRQQVYLAFSIVVALGGLLALTYGPWFAITDVRITGTRLLDPSSVQSVTQQYLDKRRWLLLPNRTLWVLSKRGLQHDLEQRIRTRLSIEGVRIEKISPHRLVVTIAERTPVATWSNGTTLGSIDRKGVVIELRPTPVEHVPLVHDISGSIFTTDSSVVKQEVVQTILTLSGLLEQANISVGEFIIPEVTCPTPIQTTPAETLSLLNTNVAVAARNTNSVTNTVMNTNTAVPSIPCDAQALRYSSQEVHVLLSEGPTALFDRHSNLEQAVQALQRVLSEPRATKPTRIDVRFGDRVYVQ